MKKFFKTILFLSVLSSFAYADEDAMQVLDKMRARIEKEEEEKIRLAAEAREIGVSSKDEGAKPKTEAQQLEATRKKAMDKLDFYERVVRSVAREEAEVSDYYSIMGEEKERPSIMDEQNSTPSDTQQEETVNAQ